jgi:hypothetical protein
MSAHRSASNVLSPTLGLKYTGLNICRIYLRSASLFCRNLDRAQTFFKAQIFTFFKNITLGHLSLQKIQKATHKFARKVVNSEADESGAKDDFDFQQDSEWIFEKIYKYRLNTV